MVALYRFASPVIRIPSARTGGTRPPQRRRAARPGTRPGTRPSTNLQRGWKWQPLGRSIGLGMSPETAGVIARRRGVGFGAAFSSACVYGCSGSANSVSVGDCSTIRPEVHDGDVLADVAHHRQVVRDEEVGEAELLLETHHQVEHLGLHGDVERRDRLVGDDELGLDRERAGDADPLPLAAAELVRAPVGELGREADALEQVGDARRARLLRHDPRARRAPRRASGARSSSGSATSTDPGR